MDNEKMALMIAQLRKEKKLTQKELAMRLGVTDKAVSKWERGLSCPDIAVLSPLSDILGITVTELLSGQKTDSSPAGVETAVEATLQFADTSVRRKTGELRKILCMAMSLLFLTGIFTCLVCDFAISGKLTWALIPISALVFAWLVLAPAIAFRKNGILISLLAISIFTVPFLYILERIIGTGGMILEIGIGTTVISVIYLWILYILFFKTKLSRFTAAAFLLLLAIPHTIATNYIVDMAVMGKSLFDMWDISSALLLMVAALVLLCIGYWRKKKTEGNVD